MAGVKRSLYRLPPTPDCLRKIENDELEWFDPEIFTSYNSGVLEQYFDERNIKKGFYRSKFVWKKVMTGILIGTAFALIEQYVGMKIGLLTSGGWYVTYIIGLTLGWDASEMNIAAGGSTGAQKTSTGFVFTFPAIFLLAYSAMYIGADGKPIIDPGSIGPILPIAAVSALMASILGVMFFIVFRRIWLVEDPLPLPSSQAFVKLFEITNSYSKGVVESARKSLRLVFYLTLATMGYVFLRDFPFSTTKAGQAGTTSILNSILPARFYSDGIVWVPADNPISRYTLLGFSFEPIQLAIGWFLRFRVAMLVGLGSLLSFFVIIPLAVSLDFPVLIIQNIELNGEMVTFSGVFSVNDPGLKEVYGIPEGDVSLTAILARARVANIIAIGAILGGGLTSFVRMLPVFRTTVSDIRRISPKGLRKDWIKGKGWYEWPSSHITIMAVITFIGVTTVFVVGGYPVLPSFIFAIVLVTFTFVFGAIAVKVGGEIGVPPVSGTSFLTLTLLVGIFMLIRTPVEITFIMALLGTTIFGTAISLASDITWDFRYGIYTSTRPVHLVKAETTGIIFGMPVAVVSAYVLSYGLAHGVVDLEAPQAHAFATYVQVLNGSGSYFVHLILLGIMIGVFMELLTGMGTAFGIGMYLPLWHVLPLILGGGVRDLWQKRYLEPMGEKNNWTDQQKTMKLLNTYMMATGLLVGSALMGTIIALYLIIPLFGGG